MLVQLFYSSVIRGLFHPNQNWIQIGDIPSAAEDAVSTADPSRAGGVEAVPARIRSYGMTGIARKRRGISVRAGCRSTATWPADGAGIFKLLHLSDRIAAAPAQMALSDDTRINSDHNDILDRRSPPPSASI